MADLVEYNFSGRDYTARFEALLTRLRAEIPTLTDLNHSDAGVSIIRLLARESDHLGFFIDEAFHEGFEGTARFKQSLIDIAKTVDILPKLAAGAKDTLVITRLEGSTDQDVLIPRYSEFTRADGKTYLTDADVTLRQGETTVSVGITEGTLVTLELDPSEFTISTLTNRAQYNLGAFVADGTIAMVHGDPETVWTEKDSLWRSVSTDYHFVPELYAEPVNDVYDTVYLTLGDGTQGAQLPPFPATVTFIRCSGAEGNTGAGTVTGVPTSLTAYIEVSNLNGATGGADAEDIESFRDRIPRVVRTQRRGVTCEDYEALLESVAGVKHVQAVDRNYSIVWPHLYVGLYVVPEGGGPMSEALLAALYAQCAEWGHLGAWSERYIILDAAEVPVNIECTIGISSGHNSTVVRSAVIAALSALITPDNFGIGDTLTLSMLHNTIDSVTGVAWVDVDSPSTNTQSGSGEILVPGTISVTVSQ